MLKPRIRLLQTLDRAQDRDCRSDHAVSIEQGGANHCQERHAGDAPLVCRVRPEPLGDDRQERKIPPSPPWLGAHHKRQVLHGHDHDQRPEHKRQDAVEIGVKVGVRRLGGGDETFLERVKRARADIAEHDPECTQGQSC